MHIHILGICGTFMAGIAVLAKQLGYTVTGSDQHVYPPMSTQLEAQGIQLCLGYEATHLSPNPDLVIIGNALRRGNPAVEYVLNKGISYVSGPQWLAEHVLQSLWVLAVSGTHGKTTTTSLLAWILASAGLEPGFLIGGVPDNFAVSAQIGKGQHFVIEADEYDSAFFDKRSKFIHYHPKTLILNNLEFDHADIFNNLQDIQKQFHYLIRTVPSEGLLIVPKEDNNLKQVLTEGCWTPIEYFALGDKALWYAKLLKADGSSFEIYHQEKAQGIVQWDLLGNHNVRNALAAIAAANHAGIAIPQAIEALATFKNVKRRLEIKGQVKGITIYDDFAHHPTAIATTLAGLRAKVGKERILVALELGSYTMRQGYHQDRLASSLQDADHVFLLKPINTTWDVQSVAQQLPLANSYDTIDDLLVGMAQAAKVADHIVIMSNTGFGSIHNRLLHILKQDVN